MATVVKKKNCKRCHKDKPFAEFPNSPHSKDGKLGFCDGCWSKKMSEASTKRYAKKSHANGKPKIGRPKGSKSRTKNGQPVIVQAANEALKAASSLKEKFLVRADDGDLAEYTSEERALRQAMEWKMSGFAVTVWRQCEFEMVLRIIG